MPECLIARPVEQPDCPPAKLSVGACSPVFLSVRLSVYPVCPVCPPVFPPPFAPARQLDDSTRLPDCPIARLPDCPIAHLPVCPAGPAWLPRLLAGCNDARLRRLSLLQNRACMACAHAAPHIVHVLCKLERGRPYN